MQASRVISIRLGANVIVERRRRDNINESIQELSIIVPASMLVSGAAQSPPQHASPAGGQAQPGKPNKGVVLRKSIEYIRLLRAQTERQRERMGLLGSPPSSSEPQLMTESEIVRLGGIVPVDENMVAPASPSSLWQDESAITEDES